MLKRWLKHTNPVFFNVFIVLAAFSTYSCMYAFRKPFTVATFTGMEFFHIDYKILLITSQVLGYTLSKFAGIRIISEQVNQNRSKYILVFILIAEAALFLFAIVPPPYNILFLFINGLPLGMIWGVVFSYLEGRRTTELLGAGLCVSFIFSSGFVKSAGKWLMLDFGITEFYMPFVTGLLFVIPLLLSVFLLDQVPPPTKEDILARTERKPMTGKDRLSMIRTFGPGLLMLISGYIILTAFRDFRDNFSAEIWNELGYGAAPEIFTTTEIPVSLIVLLLTGLMILIKNNMQALMVNHFLIAGGFMILGISTWLFSVASISPFIWVTLSGLGLYMGYVPFNSMLFERMIASFRSGGNVGFLIYLADAFGYLGSVGVLFYKNFFFGNISWLSFFKTGSMIVSISGVGLIFCSMVFFHLKIRQKKEVHAPKSDPVETQFIAS